MTEHADAEVVRQVLSGDVEAFGVLVSRYRERFGRYAFHMLGDREEAEEALQDAFVRAYRALRSCRQPDRFEAWLFLILANRCRTRGRRRSRQAARFVRDDGALDRASVDPGTGSLEWGEELGRALAQLDPEQREAFLLKHAEDLSYEEMAELTGAGVSALKMRVKRACDRLRTMLVEEDHA